MSHTHREVVVVSIHRICLNPHNCRVLGAQMVHEEPPVAAAAILLLSPLIPAVVPHHAGMHACRDVNVGAQAHHAA